MSARRRPRFRFDLSMRARHRRTLSFAIGKGIEVGVRRQWRIAHVSPVAFQRFERAVTNKRQQVQGERVGCHRDNAVSR